MENSKVKSGGIGIMGVIEVLFIALKLLGVEPITNWAWSVVLIPLWIDLGLCAFIILCVVLCTIITEY